MKITLDSPLYSSIISPMNKSLRTILSELYLDYVNNYLTVEKFAEHHEVSFFMAMQIIEEGRAIHEENCK